MEENNEIENKPELSNPERLKWMEDKLLGGILQADPTEADWAAIRSETEGAELVAEGDSDGSMMLDVIKILDRAQRVRPESMHEDSTSYFKCLQEAQWYAAGRANGSERFIYIRDDLEQHIANELVFFAFAATDKEAKRYAINKGLFMGSDFHNIDGDKVRKVETPENHQEDLRSITATVMESLGLNSDNPELWEAFRNETVDESLVAPDDPFGHDKLNFIIMLTKAFYLKPEVKDDSLPSYLKALGDASIAAKDFGQLSDNLGQPEDADMYYYAADDLEAYLLAEIVGYDLETKDDAFEYALYKKYIR